MNEYTEEQYVELLTAREFGARNAVRNLREYISSVAAPLGDGWLGDPRRVGLETALNVLMSHAGPPLAAEVRSSVDRLALMEDDLDRRESPPKIPLTDQS